MKNKTRLIEDLKLFLDESPTAWHAVDCMCRMLNENGFQELKEVDRWDIKYGGSYYIQRNRSSLCVFIVPNSTPQTLRLLASHTDSPSLKIKPKPEIRKQQTIQLGVEVYGAPLLTSWLNRDLGIAGRVITSDKQGKVVEELVRLDEDPLMIPQLAIHLDREVNEKGLLLNKQDHLNALAAINLNLEAHESYLERLLRKKIAFDKLIDFDLFLFPLEKSRLIGWEGELLASYRLDSLASVHAILQPFLKKSPPLENGIQMAIFWDNEEIGSHTAQGAESPFFNQSLERLLLALSVDREDYFRLLNQSICISVDLAHALHPSYPDKHDAQHQPLLGQGVVLKHNAQQRYATDGRSSLPIQIMADLKAIPIQKFVSRNDIPSGSTIGPLQACLTGMPTVDIGCGQLSMHSCREIIACQDHLWMCQLLESLLRDWKKII